MFVALMSAGCVGAEVKSSIAALRRDHDTFRRAVIPRPSYSDDEKKAVNGLGEDIADHLENLEDLTR